MTKTKQPLYENIAAKITEYIKQNSLDDGDLIPSEHELCQMYSVSRITVRKAINSLIEQRILHAIQGKGTYVGHTGKIHHSLYKALSFAEEMSEQNISFQNKIIDFKVQKATEKYASKLNISADDLIYNIKRIRIAENKHMAFEETYMPVLMFPGLSYNHLENSKYKYIESECNMTIDHSYEEIYPVIPSPFICKMLKCEKNIPIIKAVIISYLTDGRIFEYTRTHFNSSEYIFKIMAKRI